MALAARVRRASQTNQAADDAVMLLRRKADLIVQKRQRAEALIAEAAQLQAELEGQMTERNLHELVGVDTAALAHWFTPAGRATRTVNPVEFFDACKAQKMTAAETLEKMNVSIKNAEALLPGKVLEKIITVTPPETKDPVFVVEEPKVKKARK